MAVSAQLSKIRTPTTPTWITSSRKDMWLGLLERLNSENRSFQTFLEEYAAGSDITLSRRDVRNIFAIDPSKGVIGTIIWSHARGIRVNALSLLVRDLPTLITLMSISDFGEEELNELLAQPGISVPTASKMLSACGKTYRGMPAAIIDDNIIQAIENTALSHDFPTVATLRNKSRSRPMSYYEAYLQDVTAICEKYNITADLLDRYLAEHALEDLSEQSELKSA
ncbi:MULTISPECIES: hypothetical protein [Thalassospira]|uniref:DUF4332 domain-containing protein n=1 Tax=Thalassospira aquimaris TaxID=3037796 RepID=A0ABT6G9S4_9PROT|nr:MULTISPECIES: hypothetical protein [Thalassospira]MDG4718758.1 hypothetical protein [Thalassospira sp. FZY0004]